MDELPLVLVNIVTAFLFTEVVHLFVLNSLLEHRFFLENHYSLHTDYSLLRLRFAGCHLVFVLFLNLFVLLD